MTHRKPHNARPSSPTYGPARARHAGMAAVVALCLLQVAPASAQGWDRAAYDQQATECIHNLDFADQALSAGNSDRALTYINLALDPCDAARNMLMTGIESGGLNDRQRRTLEGDLISQDSRWVILATRLGMCQEAQQMLAETTRLVPNVPQDRMQRYLEASQAVLTCVSTQAPAQVDYGTGYPVNGTLYVGSGMAPSSGSGVAGGTQDMNARFGEPCWGVATPDPTYNIVVSTGAWVRVQAWSAADLTLVVSGPTGTFCNDDYEGLNPAIYQWLDPGTYQVWIAELSRSPSGTPYTASFGVDELVPGPTQTYMAPLYGYVTAGPGYAASTGVGMAGGPGDASLRFGGSCWGSVSEAPTYELYVPAYGLVTVQVNSTVDTTLIVTGPGGTFCNDDYNGLSPALSEYLSAGTYQVYVGEFTASGIGSSFDIRFSTEALAAPVDPYAGQYVYPTYGTAYVGPGYGTTTLSGASGGASQATMRYGGTCSGYIADNPDYVIELTQAGTVNVAVTAMDGGDTTLIVTGPSGTWCNDDVNGLNPGLTQYMGPGQYHVFVGSYWENEYHNVSVNFSAY